MEPFNESVSTSSDDLPASSKARPGAKFWKPVEHIDKVHLFAGRGGEGTAGYPPDGSMKSTADVMVVFDDGNSPSVYRNVSVYQVALQPLVAESGAHARRLMWVERDTKPDYYAFEDLNAAEAEKAKAWAHKHFGKRTDGSYDLIDEAHAGAAVAPNEDPF